MSSMPLVTGLDFGKSKGDYQNGIIKRSTSSGRCTEKGATGI